ncbi:alkyl sulfatase BDS1-like metallo-beta-lactamase superfamily hydrolase [Sediminihabitans luteus]|uniref:Linear primary-alkylsulfatase n=1 Tax=Sediminihabitans luteus TaxID=1138585 RepID=A0A2M9CQ68_9CELL|nr:alkyl sulfatase dimerization domain-containing protein [Sediminihabitans luteus]PJJ74073.1 alkyl sulfatase BDS1-like metallo-beta-lactamase superfamily hydrolase [Sediminihabitans luteus]GII98012.1 beta-lactamase-like protein [Sediminihabitans luteus]
MTELSKDPIDPILAQHRDVLASLPFDDVADFDDARRGLLGSAASAVVRDADGRVVWDNDSYAFLEGDAPPTVNPSLWRQSTLTAMQGVYEVVPDLVYQVRGFDASNLTFIEGDTGVIAVDPLVSAETAAAALALYREHRGERPVTGVIYTHCHADHYGGVRGVTTQEDVDAGRCPVIAPEGLVRHLASEWVYAGGAMARRIAYMYGTVLDRGPRGQVGVGLGQTNSTGSITLITPTVDVTATGQEHTVDGVRMVFQLAPGTEAPAEMHFYLPEHRALCVAENATHTQHNLLTLRGAEVRDAHAWAHYLQEMIDLFGGDAEVIFSPHHWPTWGNERIVEFLSLQRDLYAYLHDQTLRLLNKGYVGSEIAEMITLPPALENAWHARGYYGSVSHNVKAIYQRYMGWYDGNPAHLWQHTPENQATRYVEYMGGVPAVLERARRSFEEGDLRWVAEVVGHCVFAEPDNAEAKALLADTFEQLGYGAENGTWRNVYLAGAHELRHGNFGTPVSSRSADTFAQLTPPQVFDAIAVQIDGPGAWDDSLTIDVALPDDGVTYRLSLNNGVLTHTASPGAGAADLTITVPASRLFAALTAADPADAGARVEGDVGVLARLRGYIDAPDPDFEIVLP